MSEQLETEPDFLNPSEQETHFFWKNNGLTKRQIEDWNALQSPREEKASASKSIEKLPFSFRFSQGNP
jgi:hypothetical protein